MPIFSKQKDNSTFSQKAQLRNRALAEVETPVVLETHGGLGKLFARCYGSVPAGVVFESNPIKAAQLGRQRPTWAVYEADCIRSMAAGVGSHLPVNFVDFDPYGEPWPVMDAFLEGLKPQVPRLVLVVNDGLRQKLKMNGGWSVGSMQSVVDRIGNGVLYERYLDICKDLVKEKAAKAGYRLSRWTGYYCGFADQMTHYAAVLEKDG